MRPHVEIIDERDYIWHPAELIKGEGDARQRNLAYDEEDGSVSASVEFTSDWGRPAGVHHADVEMFVLEGELTVGDTVLRKGGYFLAAKGRLCPVLKAKAGTKVLYWREYGDWGFDVQDTDRADVRADRPFVTVNTGDMEWIPVELGSPMRFDLGGTPVPGLFIKMCSRDPITGFYTRLIHAQPGWHEHPLAHHPVFEEAYTLEGDFHYNWGRTTPGTYFFRPPLIRHGDFTAGEEKGATWILRCDGDLVDWYTDNSRLELHGDAVNWGEKRPGAPGPRPVMPVRSKSVAEMDDVYYQ